MVRAEVVVNAAVAGNAVLDQQCVIGVGALKAIGEDFAQDVFVAPHDATGGVVSLMLSHTN